MIDEITMTKNRDIKRKEKEKRNRLRRNLVSRQVNRENRVEETIKTTVLDHLFQRDGSRPT